MRKRRRKRKRRPTRKRIRKHWAVFPTGSCKDKAEKELDRSFDLAMQRENT